MKKNFVTSLSEESPLELGGGGGISCDDNDGVVDVVGEASGSGTVLVRGGITGGGGWPLLQCVGGTDIKGPAGW